MGVLYGCDIRWVLRCDQKVVRLGWGHVPQRVWEDKAENREEKVSSQKKLDTNLRVVVILLKLFGDGVNDAQLVLNYRS
jgi:hypothetical protein